MTCILCGAAHACPLPVRETPVVPVAPRGLNGIFILDKPAGKSSHSVVAAVRKISGAGRVGHAGTLDPMATGVLLVCVGQGARVSEYLIDHDKQYRARVRLGSETDTYDATGAVVAERAVAATPAQIETALAGFLGKQTQLPPAYSAIKQAGVPLYKLARRGQAVETQARAVEFFALTLREIALPEIEFDVHCSKGTYIRSLAHDLGARLGCGAHLTALRRTASGAFPLERALTLEQLRDAFAHGTAMQHLLPLDHALTHLPAVTVDASAAQAIVNGKALACGRAFTAPLLRAYLPNGECLALLERGATPHAWKPRKVFLVSDF